MIDVTRDYTSMQSDYEKEIIMFVADARVKVNFTIANKCE